MNATDYEEAQMRERIINIINKENISHRAFAISIGRDPTEVHRILKGERHIPNNGFCSAILAKYPKVDRDWLFFGDGTMYKDESERAVEFPKDTRPRLPKSGSDCILTDYYMGDKRSLCQEKPIITQFADYDFTLILKDNHMLPKYGSGDELAFKKSTIVRWGHDYLIDTTEGAMFQKIADNGDSVRCTSYNEKEYPEFIVPKNMINGYYRLVGAIRIL